MKNKHPKTEPELVKEEAVNVNFNCPVSIRDEIRRIALKDDRTLSGQVVRALREWLKSRNTFDPNAKSEYGQ